MCWWGGVDGAVLTLRSFICPKNNNEKKNVHLSYAHQHTERSHDAG